ncbi:hypothetical protein DFH08DRAFT_802499 [Mycena albidolilacea]|uniref:F-box domain-containing protein n=1 Tax=Mycena albidolilacea TaxID=1033008 RepID=A0AAD7AFB0_9AGAR|nr:hypothetical protein DFH08DRAFT_802499 [Mycena albidolilacea]
MSTLAADRARLADFDAQILDLERSLSALRSQRQPVFERLSAYTYPILTLPNEITSEIFIHFLPNYPSWPPLTGPDSPTLLAQICREWRDIALETPALSRCSPLSLELNGHAIDPLRVTELVSALVSHRSRWERLIVYNFSLSHLLAMDGPMPLLRTLELYTDDPNIEVSFLEAPLLRTVVLWDTSSETVALPWAQLTSLTLSHVSPEYCAPILRQTSNLVHCALEFCEYPEAVDFLDVTLPYLHSLTLDGRGARGEYLEMLIVPALRNLQILNAYLEPEYIPTLAAFVAKSGCKLQNLRITYADSAFEHYFCKAFPSTTINAFACAYYIDMKLGDNCVVSFGRGPVALPWGGAMWWVGEKPNLAYRKLEFRPPPLNWNYQWDRNPEMRISACNNERIGSIYPELL